MPNSARDPEETSRAVELQSGRAYVSVCIWMLTALAAVSSPASVPAWDVAWNGPDFSMNAEQRKLLVDYLMGRISYGSFLEQSGVDPASEPGFVEVALREAMVAHDAVALDYALSLFFRFEPITVEVALILAELVVQPWHHSHQNIALALQDLRAAETADALAAAALMKPDYLDFDDSHAFARKCTWALADIGTPKARRHLESLSRCVDPEIASYAQRRLDYWHEELDRKGYNWDGVEWGIDDY